ncbi:MAG TPA: hypothetical protein VLA77_03670 [Candidatus Saccharimonadales bacterium]|nr:hypothetical protein [Candidatus Saccharimonadales bacterium]
MDTVDATLDEIVARLDLIVPADRDPKKMLSLGVINELATMLERLRYLLQDEPSNRERAAIGRLIQRINTISRPPTPDETSDRPNAEQVISFSNPSKLEKPSTDSPDAALVRKPYGGNPWRALGADGHL